MSERPGEHYVVLGDVAAGVVARRKGLELRDAFYIATPEGGLMAWLLRAPLDRSTVVEQVLATGTGALAIDPCRVRTTDSLTGGSSNRCSLGDNLRGWHRPWMDDAQAQEAFAARVRANIQHAERLGRWPPNVLLVHAEGCRQAGTRKVPASNPAGPGEGARVRGVYMEGDPNAFTGNGSRVTYGENGLETVAAWACTPGCPVALLDGQSGDRRSAGMYPSASDARRGSTSISAKQGMLYTDAGTASRFYPQFTSLAECLGWLTTLLGACRDQCS